MPPVAPPPFPSMLTALAHEVEALRADWHQACLQRRAQLQFRPFWWRWLPSAHNRRLLALQVKIDTLNAGLSSRIRTGLLAGMEEWVQTVFTPDQQAAWKKQDVVVQRATMELRNSHAWASACLKADSALLRTLAVCQQKLDQANTSLLPVDASSVADSLLDTIKCLHAFAETLPSGDLKSRVPEWATGFPAFDTLQEARDYCQAVRSDLLPVLMELQAKAAGLREAHREAQAGKGVMEASVFVRVQDAMPAILVTCERNPEEFWSCAGAHEASGVRSRGLNAGRETV